MTGLESLLPGMGVLSAFVLLIGYLFLANRTDRKDYRADIRREEKAHDETQKRLDTERELRRKAEDAVATMGREIQALREQVENQSQQIAELRSEVARLAGGH